MWLLLIIFIFCPAMTASDYNVIIGKTDLLPFEYREGQRYIFLPDGNDSLHIVDLQDKRQDTKWNFDASRDVVLNLFTRKNVGAPLIIDSENVQRSVESYSMNITKPMKIVVHGWKSGLFGKIHTVLTKDLIQSLDINVIFVDWSFIADRNYLLVVGIVPEIGKYLASVIDSLVDLGIPLENMHLVGHSLGAHVAGIAGRLMKSGKLPYITGFDPALPLWPETSLRLRASDANYVEVIHTNAGILGIKDPIGHADFYPNGGTNQPGCTFDIGCAHSRSFLYYADSLDHDQYRSVQCRNIDEILNPLRCSNLSESYLGGSRPKESRGMFYLKTNSQRPYYKG